MRPITNYLIKGIEDNLTKEFSQIGDYANWMGVSPKKLQRLLYDEGTSFSEVLDQYRATKVIVLLQTTKLPIRKIARSLGYSSSVALNTACKRWHKKTSQRLMQQYRNSTNSSLDIAKFQIDLNSSQNKQWTLTRDDIANRLRQELDISKYEANDLIVSFIGKITESLESGKNVKISGFGNFVLLNKKPRLGRNVKTGQEVKIAARRVVVFKPSTKLQRRLDNACKSAKKKAGLGKTMPRRKALTQPPPWP